MLGGRYQGGQEQACRDSEVLEGGLLRRGYVAHKADPYDYYVAAFDRKLYSP